MYVDYVLSVTGLFRSCIGMCRDCVVVVVGSFGGRVEERGVGLVNVW